MDDDDLGEDIWNAFTWRANILGKIRMMRKFFNEDLHFPVNYKQMIDFLDTYFGEFWEEDGRNSEEDFPTKMKNSNVPLLIIEECFFVFLDNAKFTAVQELKILEVLCSYLGEDKLDPVRYLVFDCLFGDIVDEENRMRHAKATFLGKLISMAVGTQSKTALECFTIFMQKFGRKAKCMSVVSQLVNDFCYLVPSRYDVLGKVVDVCPKFLLEFADVLPILYSFHEKQKSEDPEDRDDLQDVHLGLPPITLITLIGSWLTNNPSCFTLKKKHDFTLLPTIHSFQEDLMPPKRNICWVVGFLHWSVLSPLFKGVKISSVWKSHFFTSEDGGTVIDPEKMQQASSLMHYGILNFFAMHRKIDPSTSGDDDDLEPGEVSEQAKPVELIFESDIREIIAHLDKTVTKLSDNITEENLGESIDRLAQIIQVAKWSGCFLPTGSKKFKHALKKVPKTKLFSKVMKSL